MTQKRSRFNKFVIWQERGSRIKQHALLLILSQSVPVDFMVGAADCSLAWTVYFPERLTNCERCGPKLTRHSKKYLSSGEQKKSRLAKHSLLRKHPIAKL